MENQVAQSVGKAKEVVVGNGCKAKDVAYQTSVLSILCTSQSRAFLNTLARSCDGVTVMVNTDAYSLALLLLCVPYYSVNHGTVFSIGRMTFVTLWNRIAECSTKLGSLNYKVVSGRCSEDYVV